jgi:hypothetical protein
MIEFHSPSTSYSIEYLNFSALEVREKPITYYQVTETLQGKGRFVN